MDFATVVYRLQLLGFNAIRLPFSFQNLYDEQPQSQIRNCANVGSFHQSSDNACPQPAPSCCLKHASLVKCAL